MIQRIVIQHGKYLHASRGSMKMADNAAFFASLYETKPANLPDDFDALVTRLVTSQDGKVVAGDQALQSVIINYLLAQPQNAENQKLASFVAGIKQGAVAAFTEAYPGVSLDTLLQEARDAGHEVQVIG